MKEASYIQCFAMCRFVVQQILHAVLLMAIIFPPILCDETCELGNVFLQAPLLLVFHLTVTDVIAFKLMSELSGSHGKLNQCL